MPEARISPRSGASDDTSALPVLHEDRASVWILTGGPTVWVVHFLVCYVAVAVACAKASSPAPLDDVRLLLGGFTVAALLMIAWLGWRGLRRHRFGSARVPHDAPTAADRHRFLGLATLLLCGLSFVAVLYSSFVIAIIGSCR